MNCAWCSPSENGTDGICDACMLLYFNVNPATIHAEIATESNARNKQLQNTTVHRSIEPSQHVLMNQQDRQQSRIPGSTVSTSKYIACSSPTSRGLVHSLQ